MSDATEELGARWQSERCPECAFDPNGFSAGRAAGGGGRAGRRYQAPLTRFLPGEDASLLVARPLPGVWSALAYACHVRDVLSVFDGRIARMLVEDAPELGWWDHEAAVEADAYEKQPPAEVAAAIAANAAALSATLSAVPDEAGTAPAPAATASCSPCWATARFALHEGTHHLLDIGRVLRAARGR